MKKRFTEEEIRVILKMSGIQVTLKPDYVPSSDQDEAAYQEIDFVDRSWKDLVLKATNRAKLSRQLTEQQTAIQRKPNKLDGDGCLRVRVFTVAAAINLQNVGYNLQVVKMTNAAAS